MKRRYLFTSNSWQSRKNCLSKCQCNCYFLICHAQRHLRCVRMIKTIWVIYTSRFTLVKLIWQKIFRRVNNPDSVAKQSNLCAIWISLQSFKTLSLSRARALYASVAVLCKNRVRYNAIKMTKKLPTVVAGFAYFPPFFIIHHFVNPRNAAFVILSSLLSNLCRTICART